MAADAPTLKARFNAFESLDDAVVQAALTEAKREAGGGDWRQGDEEEAELLLACHYLASEDALNNGAATTDPRRVISRRIGDASETYATGGAHEDLRSTVFGIRYLRLLRKNFAGPRLGAFA